MPQVDNVPDFDSFIHAKISLPKNAEVKQATTVLGQLTDVEGDPVGEYGSNQMLNTRIL